MNRLQEAMQKARDLLTDSNAQKTSTITTTCLTTYDICPKCNNGRWWIRKENGKEIITECDCFQERENKRRIEKSGLKDVFENYTFEKFEISCAYTKRLKAMAQEFIDLPLDNKKNWLYLSGRSGCGKTHLCTAICSELIKNHQVLYLSWIDDILPLKFVKNQDEYEDKINKYKHIEILYIDDFIKDKTQKDLTSADLRLAFQIIDYRYRNNLRTIFSSEIPIERIGNLDEAIAGRIVERCYRTIYIPKEKMKNFRLEREVEWE